MSSSKNLSIPRVDQCPIWDLLLGVASYPAILIAHELKIFPLLKQKSLSLTEISQAVNVASRPLQALLGVCLSLGFVKLSEGVYSLTAISEEYFIESSPYYFGDMLDFSILNYSNWTFNNFKKVVLSDNTLFSNDLFQNDLAQENQMRSFIKAMHSISLAPASVWPTILDLSAYKSFLDIGGGSAVHSMGLIKKWPHLQATVLDLQNVCKISAEFISKANLENQIATYCADIWQDPFPLSDIHFYSMIFHDWPIEKCYFLAEKSFTGLPAGGRIIIHEMLYNEEKTAPATVATLNFEMLLWVKGQEFSGQELALILQNTGFINVEVKPSFGYWGIVTGCKPN